MKHISQLRQDLDVSAGLLGTAASLTDDAKVKRALEASARQITTLMLDLSHYTFSEASTHVMNTIDLLPKWEQLRTVKNGQPIFSICKSVTSMLK